MKSQMHHFRNQSGATLIEVLVAVLILSFGLLSLGAMLSYSVQLPKLSGHRTIAINIGSDFIERIRANPDELKLGSYTVASNYDGTYKTVALANCAFPNCTPSTLASMDVAATQNAASTMLPAGGIMMNCDGADCTLANTYGNLWVIWQEPSTNAVLNASNSDACPPSVVSAAFDPAPRCIYLRFKI